jgi:hypothetical protein
MQIPWFAGILRLFPFIAAKTQKFGGFAVQRAKIRASKDISQKDLFFHLVCPPLFLTRLKLNCMQGDRTDDPEFSSLPMIIANSVLAIIAGSDTTASALSNIVYYLLSNPHYLVKLQEELDDNLPEDISIVNTRKLEELPWLNAIM